MATTPRTAWNHTPKNLAARGRMRRKLQTRRGRQRYALRKETVELV